MIHLPHSDHDRRRRPGDEGSDWCYKRRRAVLEKTELEMHLELLISGIAEKRMLLARRNYCIFNSCGLVKLKKTKIWF
ncbi:Uncharacterized protein BM_BM3810 [Brugia malayi]|uniref:Bm3810, isoform i n=1 Tax=Brugia malayi TaxID=6279 RepID=A0A1P6BZ57_BRUMA|nr:Uncharacterized protein BM_BM3810 [Brugia malayi]CDQ02527.1 Bm3810, isoform i [Brugia malayi]VIO96533.1 Uncharacterized protein BM_BM3810 [Brugia malayi]